MTVRCVLGRGSWRGSENLRIRAVDLHGTIVDESALDLQPTPSIAAFKGLIAYTETGTIEILDPALAVTRSLPITPYSRKQVFKLGHLPSWMDENFEPWQGVSAVPDFPANAKLHD